MARIRTIKPIMFKDADLANLGFGARWFFIGLLTLADRDGRLRDDPREIGVEVIPYDLLRGKVRSEDLLSELEPHFITRYQVDGKAYIQINTFSKHQRPHHREPPSEIPIQPQKAGAKHGPAPESPGQARPGLLDKGEGNGNRKGIYPSSTDDGFSNFWESYPRHIAKKEALKIWKRLDVSSELLSRMLVALEEQKRSDQWKQVKYIPYPSTWLNQARWEDEIKGASQNSDPYAAMRKAT